MLFTRVNCMIRLFGSQVYQVYLAVITLFDLNNFGCVELPTLTILNPSSSEICIFVILKPRSSDLETHNLSSMCNPSSCNINFINHLSLPADLQFDSLTNYYKKIHIISILYFETEFSSSPSFYFVLLHLSWLHS